MHLFLFYLLIYSFIKSWDVIVCWEFTTRSVLLILYYIRILLLVLVVITWKGCFKCLYWTLLLKIIYYYFLCLCNLFESYNEFIFLCQKNMFLFPEILAKIFSLINCIYCYVYWIYYKYIVVECCILIPLQNQSICASFFFFFRIIFNFGSYNEFWNNNFWSQKKTNFDLFGPFIYVPIELFHVVFS